MKKAKLKRFFGRSPKRKTAIHLYSKTKLQLLFGEAAKVDLSEDELNPKGLTAGRPFKTLALGQVCSRMNGEPIGDKIDVPLIQELARVYQERQAEDPVIIDWQHATSPHSGLISSPEVGTALGQIVKLEARPDGLWAYPEYNEQGLDIIERSGGLLWSSPEYLQGPIYARDGGDLIGQAQLLAITLTPRPAQAHNTIDPITLTEELMMEREEIEALSPEDKTERIIALEAMITELKAKIEEMQADSESQIVNDEVAEEVADALAEDTAKSEAEINALSERTAQLLSENQKLTAQLKQVRADMQQQQREQAVSSLLSEGRITPAQKQAAEQAYDLKEKYPDIWASFSASQSVNLSEVGHSLKADHTATEIMQAIDSFQAEHKIVKYSEALEQYAKLHPDQVKEILK